MLQNHKIIELPQGAIHVKELKQNYQLKCKSRGLRPGKQVNNDIIVTLGKRLLLGERLTYIAKDLGISRKTAQRWRKRLGFNAQSWVYSHAKTNFLS